MKLFNRAIGEGESVFKFSFTKQCRGSQKFIFKLDDILAAPRSSAVVDAFMTGNTAGINLSVKVRELTCQNKQMMEELFSNGIIQGKAFNETEEILLKYLTHPERFFKRIRNKDTSRLEYSMQAKTFYSGEKVYRSSFQNARRLANTQPMIAYRMADHHRWNINPFVVGFDICPSQNHSQADMCDFLKGRYPKTFLFFRMAYKMPMPRCAHSFIRGRNGAIC